MEHVTISKDAASLGSDRRDPGQGRERKSGLVVAVNVSRLYSARGDMVDIKVVAFNAGLHMLRPDTSPVGERIVNFAASMPNVEFQACNNTREAMAKKSGKDVPIYDFAEVVPAGVVSIIELDEQGYTIVRP